MEKLKRLSLTAIFILAVSANNSVFSQKKQSKDESLLYMEQAEEIAKDGRVNSIVDAADLIVVAAELDTTNIKANWEAGYFNLLAKQNDFGLQFLLRAYRQDRDYKFNFPYWLGQAYQAKLDFGMATKYYNLYLDRLQKTPEYSGNDKTELKEVKQRIEDCKKGQVSR